MTITIKYGRDNQWQTDRFPEGTPVGTVRLDPNVQSILQCGENTQALIHGSVQPDSNTVREGDVITLEAKAARKAS